MIESNKNMTFNKIEDHHFQKEVIYRPDNVIYRSKLIP